MTTRKRRELVGKMIETRKHPGHVTTRVAAAVTGIAGRTLRSWCAEGLVRPKRLGGDGKAGVWVWDVVALIEIRAVRALLDAGASPQRVRKAVRSIRSLGGDLASSTLIYDTAGDVLSVMRTPNETREALESLVKAPGQRLILGLGAWMKEARHRIEQVNQKGSDRRAVG